MSVKVVGDLPHHWIDRERIRPELLDRDSLQHGEHVRTLVVSRRRSALLPHDHRHVADLTIGDPAHIVLVIPRGEASRLAQLAETAHVRMAKSLATTGWRSFQIKPS